MKHIKLGTLGVIYGVTTIIALTLVGVFFFKEQLTIYETLGIIAGVTSIILLSRFN
jgi:multidrug transporter EmrE-like cation transporter